MEEPLPNGRNLPWPKTNRWTIAAEGIERGWTWVNLLTPTKSTKQEGMSHASA
jgi:hypothetical protein